MTNFIVLAILIVLLVIVLMQLSRKSKAAALPARGPQPDLANLKVTDARSGDVLSVSGAGDGLSDLDFTVDRYTRYETGAHRWMELGGGYRERRVGLRVAGDDELEVAVQNDARKLTLEDLGLSEDDLAQMDERQNTSDSFEFDGSIWYYIRSRETRAWRDNQPPAQFYYWEFREQDGKRLLGIRKAEGEPFAVSMYTGIAPADVTVYRPAGGV